MPHPRACVVSLPWDYYQSPSVAIGCLSAYARTKGVAVDGLHLHLESAALFGLRRYDVVAYKHPVVGEALAAMHVLPDQRAELLSFARDTFEDAEECSQRLFEVLRQVYERYDWSRYRVVGLTIHFAQLFSSVLFASWLKQDHPEVRVVLGGGCMTDGLARSVIERFPWIDWCHRGDGEEALTTLVRGAIEGLAGLDPSVPGLVYRQDGAILSNPRTALKSLDGLPDPDYDHYFELRRTHPNLKGASVPCYLPVEVSRGCLHRCTFCNFNAGISYRPRPHAEVAASMRRLASRYRVNAFCLMALMIPVNQTEAFFKAIAARGRGYRIFCEGRANLTKQQLRVMRLAGVTELQAGIEALDTRLLRKMKKGTRLIDNLQVMKFSEELGIRMNSFLMLGFPTETQAEIDRSVEAIDFACGYAPLTQIAPFTLREGSPIDRNPSAYGLYDVSSAGLFSDFVVDEDGKTSLGPMAIDPVNGIDYWYKRYRSRRKPCDHSLLQRRISLWQQLYERAHVAGRPLISYIDSKDFLTIEDRRTMVAMPATGGRSPSGQTSYVLDGWERDLYLFCDSIRDFAAIAGRLPGVDPKAIRRTLKRLVSAKVIFGEGDQYLSLAINGHPSRRQGTPFPWA